MKPPTQSWRCYQTSYRSIYKTKTVRLMRYQTSLLRWTVCLLIGFRLCSTAYSQTLPDSLRFNLPEPRPIGLSYAQARQAIEAGIAVSNLRYQVQELELAVAGKDTIIVVLREQIGLLEKQSGLDRGRLQQQTRLIRRQRGELWGHRFGLLAAVIQALLLK